MTDALRDPEAIRERFATAMSDRPEKLQKHVRRVERGALRLAAIHELDRDICAAAAAGHDLFRHCKGPELVALSRHYCVPISEDELAAPIVLHGPLASAYARATLNVEHEEILSAIAYHTTAHPEYSLEALAVFMADKIDPRKVQRDPGLTAVAAAAEHDLYAAAAMFLERRLTSQLNSGQPLHPLAVASRNAFLRRAL
ncbi:MAG: bis(5'-nucleosyl)-tetraphosphatase (symmetrical) YqeK [Chloroflexota bacterium]|nr:bis(5'-nucleosyl)-tetraphosphatase (symmetrical) YqeK [Chloroflexota bacterium]